MPLRLVLYPKEKNIWFTSWQTNRFRLKIVNSKFITV
jgi:hypothetical protein